MKITLLAIGTRMPDWVEEGFREYQRRFPNELALELKEIPLPKRNKNPDIPRLMKQEGEAMLSSIADGEFVIALDVKGKGWSTEELSQKMAGWQMDGRNVVLLVGGPDGLAPEALARAELKWSLSPLTLPHPLVRVVVAEQLYRAWSILANHPYHRQ